MSDTNKAERWSQILNSYQVLSDNPRQNWEVITEYVEFMIYIIQDFKKSGLTDEIMPIKSMYTLGLQIEAQNHILWVVTNEFNEYALQITEMGNMREVIYKKNVKKEDVLMALYDHINSVE